MAASDDRIKYCTSVDGYYIYRYSEVDCSKFKDCIIAHNEFGTNVMIVDHVPSNAKGWNIIRNIHHSGFKLISDGNPCANCANAYECIFKKNVMLPECIEACGSLLKKQDPLSGFKYVKSGYTVNPFCTPELSSISLDIPFIKLRTKEVQEASSHGRHTKRFRREHCSKCVFDCAYIPRNSSGCKLTQAELYDTLDKEIKIRFGSYENAMSMLVNCGKILWINKCKYVVASPITSNYYLVRKTSRPFTPKFLNSNVLGTKIVKCTKRNIMNLRTMVAYQNAVKMLSGSSKDWKVFFGGYILPMAFVDMDSKETDLVVYCRQPSRVGRRIYYKDPEEVIRVQYQGMSWNFDILYPFSPHFVSAKNHKYTPAGAIHETRRFSKTPEKYLQIWNAHLNKYKAIEVINNPKIKQGGKLRW